MRHEWKSRLKPVSPYDFDLSASIFLGGDKQIRRYENGRFWQVIRLSNKLVLASVRSVGTVDAPELALTLASPRILNGDEQAKQAPSCTGSLTSGSTLSHFIRV